MFVILFSLAVVVVYAMSSDLTTAEDHTAFRGSDAAVFLAVSYHVQPGISLWVTPPLQTSRDAGPVSPFRLHTKRVWAAPWAPAGSSRLGAGIGVVLLKGHSYGLQDIVCMLVFVIYTLNQLLSLRYRGSKRRTSS